MKSKYILMTLDYPPKTGGVARYLSELVNEAQGEIEVWIDDRPTSHVLRPTSENTWTKTQDSKFEVRSSKFVWSMWPKWLPMIKRCLEVPKGKMLLVSHVLPAGTAAWIASYFGGPYYAVFFHGTDLKRIKSRWKRWLLRQICNRAEVLVVNSEETRERLEFVARRTSPFDILRALSWIEARVLRRGQVFDDKILVVTPGVRVNEKIDKFLAREKLGIASDDKIVLSVSRLVLRKGLDVLITASTKSKFEIHSSKFVLIGEGDQLETLKKLAEFNNAPVDFKGRVTDEELELWYAAADVFCLPGRETDDDVEGFGMVFLEAAAHGLPVIAGDSGGAREAVVDGETGILITPDVEHTAEALGKLLSDGSLCQKMGEAGRKRAIEEFGWGKRWARFSDKLQVTSYKSEEDIGPRNSKYDRAQLDEIRNTSISIVIPCYNHARELQKTLEALSRQIIKPSEVIVVDNGSDDDPEKVVKVFMKELPIRIIKYTEKQGAPAARNFGARQTQGDLVMFLDADVALVPVALEKLYTVLGEEKDAAFAYCDFYWGWKLFTGREFDIEALKKMNFIHTSALMRREWLIDFDESLKKFQDWDLWLSIAEKGGYGVYVPEVLFKVKERASGMSRWVPAFMHAVPWPIWGWTPEEVVKYRKARDIVYKKHHISYKLQITSYKSEKNL